MIYLKDLARAQNLLRRFTRALDAHNTKLLEYGSRVHVRHLSTRKTRITQ
jgi:hypothetical protein